MSNLIEDFKISYHTPNVVNETKSDNVENKSQQVTRRKGYGYTDSANPYKKCKTSRIVGPLAGVGLAGATVHSFSNGAREFLRRGMEKLYNIAANNPNLTKALDDFNKFLFDNVSTYKLATRTAKIITFIPLAIILSGVGRLLGYEIDNIIEHKRQRKADRKALLEKVC